ncbi:MAG: hypothetical protein LJF15_15315 [Acidobacteria bacterium]|nr:hypothetical protein [Acidobacteriota bacterium]
MTALGRPPIVVGLLATAALVLHPAVRTQEWLPVRPAAVAALLLLTALALVARALVAPGPRRLAARLLAGGAVLVLAGVGGDGVLGHRGRFDLVPGQARTHFDEIGVEGRALGLRPFGFSVGLEGLEPAGGAALVWSDSSERAVLTTERAAGHGGYRFGRPRTVPTGGAARLRVGISGGGDDVIVDLAPGRPAQAGDLRVTLEEYYPDFALDEQRQPFTRSLEARNPGAVLLIESPRGSFRAFVLRSMPGVHRVEEIGRSFALIDVEPEMSVEIDVHREPLAALALLGALLVLAAVIVQTRAP